MEISIDNSNGIHIFKISGRLDSNTSLGFEEKIIGSIGDGADKIIVDFGDLDYISSAGLRILNKASKQLKRNNGKIIICNIKDYVMEVFEIAGFDQFLPIAKSHDDALNGF